MQKQVSVLLVSVFIIAICGILYELLISTLTSYFQGSSILHFSIVIGLFLSFMGVGSFFSRYIKHNLLEWFIRFELWLGLLGGFATFILYLAFSLTGYFYLITFILIGCIGILIGIEIPILTRIIREYDDLRQALSNVLSFDYLGALIASLLFPLILLPTLGTMRTAFLVGMLNVGVALVNTLQFKTALRRYQLILSSCISSCVLLLVGFIFSFQLLGFFEQFLYQDEILLSRQSIYQKIIVTRWNDDVRLFLDGNLQFSSRDEHRYHEALVHIPLALVHQPGQVAVLGGGDGLAVREILKYPSISSVTVVDLDKAVTDLGANHPVFKRLNQNALNDPRVKILNQDAYQFIEQSKQTFDAIIIDLPDPHNTSLGKLYSNSFYHMLEKSLAVGGVVVTQSSSPYFAKEAFWCIHHTMESQFDKTFPYHVYIPSFGIWGFNMGYHKPDPKQVQIESKDLQNEEPYLSLIAQHIRRDSATLAFQFLTPDMMGGLFTFDQEMREVATSINRLDNQSLIQYYQQSWNNWR